MHPWLESLVNVCRNRKNDNMDAFDDDPLATSINLQRHCYGEFSSAAVQANTSMEDQSQVEVASKSALFLGVYDGHGGVDASRFLCEHLFDNLLRIANENENTITQATLSNAVSATEDGFLDFVKTNYIVDPNLGKVGSCCLAGIIWKGTLHVTNLGDSRAVIGTMINKKIHAEQLTRDHNCNDQAIREELKSMHLDDPTIVMEKNGAWRVKGIIMVSRTIGDAYLKRPEFTLCESFPKFQKVPEPFTRGVVSAEPEMRSRVLTDSDKFLIFASDGLWDLMSNEEAAEIVQKNPRNGIAKRLLSTALAEAASRREVTYRNMMAADPGRDSRRIFHDDISVIVVFLDKTSFLRRRVRNLSYKGSSDMPTLSAFAWSGLTTSRLQLMNPKRLKESINSRFKSGSSHASSSQAQGPQSPPIPLSRNPQTPEAEDSQSVSLLGQSSRAQSRWKNVELKFSPKRISI